MKIERKCVLVMRCCVYVGIRTSCSDSCELRSIRNGVDGDGKRSVVRHFRSRFCPYAGGDDRHGLSLPSPTSRRVRTNDGGVEFPIRSETLVLGLFVPFF